MTSPSTSPSPSPDHARASRRRGVGGVVVRVALMAALSWLTYRNATDSPALAEAIAAEARGDYPTAARAAIEHLDHRPWSREAGRIAARCLSRLDFAELAEPYYRRARDLSVDDLRYRAYGLTRANLRDRAVRAFDEVLAIEPDDVASLRLKAGILISMSRPNDADLPPDRALGPNAEPLIAISRWGEVAEIGRRLSGFSRGAIEVPTPITAGGHWTFRPREVASVAAVGATLEAIAAHNQGDAEGAVKSYERVRTLDPDLRSMPLDRTLFWSQFAADLLAVGKAAELVRRLGEVEEARADPALVVLRARAHEQLGEPDAAEACWRTARELAPDDPSAWLNLGRIESSRGNLEEAAKLLARAAELSPASVDAAYNLGLAYRKLGRAEEARKWEQEASRLLLRREEKSRSLHQPSQSPAPSPPPAS